MPSSLPRNDPPAARAVGLTFLADFGAGAGEIACCCWRYCSLGEVLLPCEALATWSRLGVARFLPACCGFDTVAGRYRGERDSDPSEVGVAGMEPKEEEDELESREEVESERSKPCGEGVRERERLRSRTEERRWESLMACEGRRWWWCAGGRGAGGGGGGARRKGEKSVEERRKEEGSAT